MQIKMNRRTCTDRLTFTYERKKAENGNEQIKKFLTKPVLPRSSRIKLFNKVKPNQSTQKIKRVLRDETAYPVNGYRPIIFSEAMEICFILNQRPNESDERRIMAKEKKINFLFDQRK